MKLFASIICVIITVLISNNCHASEHYIITPSQNQFQSELQKSDIEIKHNWPVVVTYAGDVSVSVAADGKQHPDDKTIVMQYEVRAANQRSAPVFVDGTQVSATLGGVVLQRRTLGEMLAIVDKKRRSVNFWGNIAAIAAGTNASRTAGRYNYSGTSSGVVTDQYGNQANVSSTNSGTIVDQDEAQRAANDAVAASAEDDVNQLDYLDSFQKTIMTEYKEHFVVGPGGAGSSHWEFHVPSEMKGRAPLTVEFNVGGNHYITRFEVDIE